MENKKYVIVLRHGDCLSTPKGELNKKGLKEVNQTSIALKEAGFKPEFIVTSTTLRTRESSSLLQLHFNNVAKEFEYGLFFEESNNTQEIDDLLKTINKDYKTIIISGHAETVNSFNYHMLNDEDVKKLVTITSSEDIDDYMSGKSSFILSSARTGDATIFETDNDFKSWKFHSYIKDGKLALADEIQPHAELKGSKLKMKKDFPRVVLSK